MTPPRSTEFEGGIARANSILARTLYDELVASGRSRGELISLMNVLLGLVASGDKRESRGAPLPLMVDPQTGLPTRAAVHHLLLHHVDPEGTDERSVALLAFRLSPVIDVPSVTDRLRQTIRQADVLSVLPRRTLVVFAYPRRAADLGRISERLLGLLGNACADHTAQLVKRGQSASRTWGTLLRFPSRRRSAVVVPVAQPQTPDTGRS